MYSSGSPSVELPQEPVRDNLNIDRLSALFVFPHVGQAGEGESVVLRLVSLLQKLLGDS